MDIPSYFTDFLAEIRPPDSQRDRMAAAHRDLKERLEADKLLAPSLVSTFIQGSYRRHTGLIGTKENQCDVDLVVVTRIPSQTPPAVALDSFRPFLEANYKGRYEPQGRSWCIQYNDEITLDLVPTSAPSEVNEKLIKAAASWAFEEWGFEKFGADPRDPKRLDPLVEAYQKEVKSGWQSEPLMIPDRDAKKWERTHPLAQIEWTTGKNERTIGHFVNVVRAVKWWRRTVEPQPKYPKGYPLEHLIGVCCADGIGSIAEGVARSFQAIRDNYFGEASTGRKPYLRDHGVPEHDVFARVPTDHFAQFYERVQVAAQVAQAARKAETVAESANLWRKLFGDIFPPPPDEEKAKKPDRPFTPREGPTRPSEGRFA